MTIKAHIYRPRHIQQKTYFQGVLIGCTDTALAMLVDATTLGAVKTTEKEVRALSDERLPDPKSPGLNLPQLVAVAKKLRISLLNMSGQSATALRKYLDEERRAVVQIWYADIGGGNIGHAVFVQCRRQDPKGHWQWLVNDPIKRREEWIAETRMLEAMQEFAHRTGMPSPGLRFAVSRKVPRVATGY